MAKKKPQKEKQGKKKPEQASAEPSSIVGEACADVSFVSEPSDDDVACELCTVEPPGDAYELMVLDRLEELVVDREHLLTRHEALQEDIVGLRQDIEELSTQSDTIQQLIFAIEDQIDCLRGECRDCEDVE